MNLFSSCYHTCIQDVIIQYVTRVTVILLPPPQCEDVLCYLTVIMLTMTG